MPPLFGTAEGLTSDFQEMLKLIFSGTSLVITAYFWFVRANRERVSLGIFPVDGFEGSLESGGVGLWAGRIILTNRSIVPTAVIAARAELWWDGRWVTGNVVAGDGSELPWNLPPSQATAKTLNAAFDLGLQTSREQVYADQRLRLTFITVEGYRAVGEFRTHAVGAAARAA